MENSEEWAKWASQSQYVGLGNFPAETQPRSHRMAEKRRRDRISSHLSSLRRLLPNSDKMEKAALLANVIEQVKELEQHATESPFFPYLPTESDQVTVETQSDSQELNLGDRSHVFRASLSCEDRPEVLSEIVRALEKLQLEMIQADIVCIGGRMRNNFVLVKNGCSSGETSATTATTLKQSLGAVLSRITSSSSTASGGRIRSKRQRWFMSSHYSQ